MAVECFSETAYPFFSLSLPRDRTSKAKALKKKRSATDYDPNLAHAAGLSRIPRGLDAPVRLTKVIPPDTRLTTLLIQRNYRARSAGYISRSSFSFFFF